MSSTTLRSAYADVCAFHHAFRHPAPAERTTQPADRCVKRAAWIDEESGELREAPRLVDQADALVDVFYFGLGGLVELGEPAEAFTDEAPVQGAALTFLDIDAVDSLSNAIEAAADVLRHAGEDRDLQLNAYLRVIALSLTGFASLGVNWAPLFDIVQGANMAKLHLIDGKLVPVYKADTKVKKPDGWVAPEPLLEAEIARQAALV